MASPSSSRSFENGLGILEMRGGFYDGPARFSGIAGFENSRADENRFRAQLHARARHRRV